jgi:uracil-DNA glycosylase
MPSDFDQLLDATLHHLQGMKERGVRFVNASPEALAALAQAPAPSRRSTPAPVASLPPAVAATVDRGPTTSPGPASAAPKPVSPPPQPAPPAATPPAGPPADKAAAMAQLRSRALACKRCPHLVKARTQVVFGVGDINSPLMFVGEAPGADEDAQGEPFVGVAGQLLTKIIQAMGLSRQSVYIANILKCRPDTPGQSSGNRAPTEEEMETCIPYLLEQIDLIQPRVIVALGGTAVKGLLHSKTGIMRLRGQWQTFRGIPTMPTYHPAFLLRNQAMSEKRKVWEDMLQVMEKLGLPISDKQRGHFLPRS